MKTLRDLNRKPTHPGAVLREDVLPSLGCTQCELAIRPMVSRQTVNQLLRDQRSITTEMAVGVSRAVGGSPESWLRMREVLGIWQA